MLATEIKNTVLELPAQDKVELVELLCDALDKPDADIEKKLVKISEKRYQEWINGDVKALDARDVANKIKNAY